MAVAVAVAVAIVAVAVALGVVDDAAVELVEERHEDEDVEDDGVVAVVVLVAVQAVVVQAAEQAVALLVARVARAHVRVTDGIVQLAVVEVPQLTVVRPLVDVEHDHAFEQEHHDHYNLARRSARQHSHAHTKRNSKGNMA